MSVRKRNGSRFYFFDITVRGERLRGSTKQTTKYLAEQVVAKLRNDGRERGVDAVKALLRDAPVLADFSTTFLKWVEDSQSLEPATKRTYKNGWRLLASTPLAGMRMDAITHNECDGITFPGGGYTANHALACLRRMLTKAHEMKLIFHIPEPRIKLRKVWPRTLAMTIADAKAIAARMNGTPRDAFLILRSTGMRPKECFCARWEFVNWTGLHYQNPRGKTKTAQRSIPLLGESLEILRRRHLEQGSPAEGWVFPSDSACGHLVSIAKAFSRARDLAGLPKALVLYTARHGRMSDLAQVCTLKETMDIGGHSDIKIATSYQHPNTQQLQAKLAEAETSGRIM